MGDERHGVLRAIEKQLKKLEKTEFDKLIPEVGSNLAYAIKNPRDFKDVAAVPGRIRNAMGRPVYLKPKFGASRHVASIILAAMKYNPEKRSAINIRYSPEIISASENIGVSVVFVDRVLEPALVKEKEGASVPWVLERAIEKSGKIPDVIYHKGAVGKEAMTQILGKDPDQVVAIVLKILDSLKF